MLTDYSQGWRKRNNLSWSGIRLHVPERTPRKGVTTIVLHQWGAEVGLSKAALHRISKGYTKREQEWLARMGRAPYHFGAAVTEEGKAISAKLWPGEVYTNQCGELNSTTIGVGVAGLFPRLLASGDHPHPVELARAIQGAVRGAVEEVKALALRNGEEAVTGPVLLLTHSQFSTKRRDPGERIVSALAPLLDEGLIRGEPGFSAGRGEPWPTEWRRYIEASGTISDSEGT